MSSVPLDPHARSNLSFDFEGLPPSPPGQKPLAEVVWASPGYPATLGVPLLRGRDLAQTDDEKAPFAVLVNEAFVRKYFGGAGGVGRGITRFSNDKDVWRIVGVIGDIRTERLDKPPPPMIVVPYAQAPISGMYIALRSAGSPMSLLPQLREELRAVDASQPLSGVHSLAEVAGESMAERRFQMMLLSAFALVALALAAIGIYGVTAYTVAQRSREIGIRMALGAQAGQVRRMVLVSGLRLAGLGVGIGLLGAMAVTRAIAAFLYGVSATDPLTFALVSALLFAVALLASWAPAHRATRVDPMLPLRAG
jgi:predicted permease